MKIKMLLLFSDPFYQRKSSLTLILFLSVFGFALIKNVGGDNIEPLWLNSTNDAIDSGIDVNAVYRLHCGRVGI